MLALYRNGRQSDALRAYRDGRRILAEELGLDPGAELELLERQILDHDRGLDAPSSVVPPAPPRQERKTVTVLVVEATADGASDPEELERAIAPFLTRARHVLERHGGRAEPLFANALFGIFGAPRAHDDDPVRAIRAALDLLESEGTAAQVRGGIETGEALVTIEGLHVAVTGEVLAAA